jgi:peptide/nickel transport system substrate-binding protein
MKHKFAFTLVAVLVVLSMLLAACGQEPAATEAPTEPPAPTEVPFTPMSYSAPDCEYGGLIKSIEAVDRLTVKFNMCTPDPAFPSKIAFSVFAIQPSEYLEATGGGGENSALLEKPIGTGPYMIGEWKRGDELVFVRNEDYWGEKAKMPTLVFRWSSEAAQRLLELQAGTVDGIDNIGPDDFDTVRNDSNLQLKTREGFNIFYVGMNNTYAPFDDVKVRQAIAMGIDRQRLVDNFMPEGSAVASHFTPCLVANGCVGDAWYDFDPVAAKALLAEAGYPDGFETTITYRDVVRAYLPQPAVVAQDLQAQLMENLNIKAEIVVMESGAFLDAADSGLIEGLHLLGWNADYPDQTNFLDYHFGAGSSAQFGEKFTDLTDTLKTAASLASDSDREPYYVTANNLIKEHIPMVPISHAGSALAYKATVEGAHSSPLGNEYFAVMNVPGQDTFVWMQNAEPISLYCADETDGESLRACEQVTEALLSFEVGGLAVKPGLATACNANADLTEWTCNLRDGVKFHDGSAFDANDVVLSLAVQWDYAHPLHKGNTGAFTYWSSLWGGFLNAPPSE